MRLLSAGWTWIRFLCGRVLNAAGVPGVIVPGSYDAGLTPASVSVVVGPLFTVVSVNGLDVYFDRFTGKIDGIGFSPPSGCRPGPIPESAHSDEPIACPPLPPARN